MRAVGNVGSSPLYNPSQGLGAVSASGSAAAAAFQKASGPAGLISSRGVTGLATTALSSQTTSTLMQEQDISQEEIHGGGGGGHGHGGGMKGMRNIEAEEAAGSEEAQQTRKRKKLLKAGQAENAKETAELDENGEPIKDDAERTKTRKKNDADRDVWGWL